MSALAGFLAGAAATVFLAGVVVAWVDALSFMRAEHGSAPSAWAVLGGTAVLLAGMAGAAVGMLALAMALEVVR